MNDYKKIDYKDYSKLLSKEGKYKVIEYYSNGNIWYEEYFINDLYHREDGPVRIRHYDNGDITYEEYYLCDKSFFKEEYYSPKIQAILNIAKNINVLENRLKFIKLSLKKELDE